MSNGNIKVVDSESNYKRISKNLIRNKEIDCTTLGVYAKIVVLGMDWQLNIKGLANVLGLSDAKVRKSIIILERNGYIKRTANYHDGKLDGWTYEVYPEPLDKKERSAAGYSLDSENEMLCCAEPSLTQNQTTLKTDYTENGEDNNNILNINTDLIKNNKEEKEVKEKDELFEQCWIAYNRKGSKKKAREYWNKLTQEEKESVLQHIKAYVSTRELSYQKDFERYLRDKIFTTLVFKGNSVVYDPSIGTSNVYHPQCNGNLRWNNIKQCYMYIGMFIEQLADGYTDDNRPDGATIVLNNARGTIQWNAALKKWEKKQDEMVINGQIYR